MRPSGPEVRAWPYTGALIVVLLIGIHLQLMDFPNPLVQNCEFGAPAEHDQAVIEDDVRASRKAAEVGSLPVQRLLPLSNEHSWRFGFGMPRQAHPGQWAEAIGAGWYLDWGAVPQQSHLDPEYWLTVRVAPSCARPTPLSAARLARLSTGRTWVIGNEPDVIWQDNRTPEAYATAYWELYKAIKKADPTAQVAVGAVSQSTPLRLTYLDRVLEAYAARYGRQMPVDIWTVHGFVLREQRGSWGVGIPPGFSNAQGRSYELSDHGRLDLFEAQLRDFRRWMATRGYRDRPLTLTEFGILMPPQYGFPEDKVVDYLLGAFELLHTMSDPEFGFSEDGYRLVQRWAWYSLEDNFYPTGNLAQLSNGTLTPLGQAYRSYVSGLQNTP
ncbi:MAG: hypothetical protein ACE5M4_13450 [Anaerolineales bacterium]